MMGMGDYDFNRLSKKYQGRFGIPQEEVIAW
jgi:hypothetical protein